MRAPPFLCGAALLFWGACSGNLWLAAGMTFALEGVQRVPRRWALGRRDFEVLADVCTLALAGVLSYQFAQTRHFPNSLATVLGWLPAFYLPLVLAQRASAAGRVPVSALVWSLRRRAARSNGDAVTLDYAYAGLTLLSAGAANLRSPWFFTCTAMLCLYALWPARRSGASPARWAALAGAAAASAFALQAGLTSVQQHVEEAVLEWLTARWDTQGDPYRARTAIGDVGRVKLSDRIVLRVRTPQDADRPARAPLLRTAAYQRYAAGGWTAHDHVFARLQEQGTSWDIARGAGQSLDVSAWLTDGRALLALPANTYRMEGLRVARAERNGLGAVRVEDGPEPLSYRAWYDAERQTEAPPQAHDLDVPPALAPVMERVARDIGTSAGADDFIARTRAFFATRFAYSLSLTSASGATRDLARFLLTDRRGHCEYFATATTLLLRQAGVPARYAVGYSVHEYSPLEGQYIVRRRDAHAWTIAWVGGAWVDIDTTPSTWYAEESQDASTLQPLLDVLSWLNFRLATWRSAESGAHGSLPWWLLASALAALLGWRLYRKGVRVAAIPTAAAPRAAASPLQPALDQLARAGHVRPPGVPLLRWMRELPLPDARLRQLLLDTVRLHYALRFGAAASGPGAQAQLRDRVAQLAALLRAERRR